MCAKCYIGWSMLQEWLMQAGVKLAVWAHVYLLSVRAVLMYLESSESA